MCQAIFSCNLDRNPPAFPVYLLVLSSIYFSLASVALVFFGAMTFRIRYSQFGPDVLRDSREHYINWCLEHVFTSALVLTFPTTGGGLVLGTRWVKKKLLKADPGRTNPDAQLTNGDM